jgi:uncharacterized protein
MKWLHCHRVRSNLNCATRMATVRKVKCPSCKKQGDWLSGAYGPFCSQRCKLVDLGKWLGEENKISEPLRPEHFGQYEKLPPGEHLDKPEGESDN